MTADLTLVLAILMAFAFALTNGFHDAANSIATLVATRIARPLPAVAMASVFNLLGPLLFGAAVANTVGKLVTVNPANGVAVIGAGLTGAVIWNVYTWRRSLPSSSSHALVGGLVGAALLDSGPGSINLGPFQDGHLYGLLGVLIGLLVATSSGSASPSCSSASSCVPRVARRPVFEPRSAASNGSLRRSSPSATDRTTPRRRSASSPACSLRVATRRPSSPPGRWSSGHRSPSPSGRRSAAGGSSRRSASGSSRSEAWTGSSVSRPRPASSSWRPSSGRR